MSYYGSVVRNIRIDKGYSQDYLSHSEMTQSAYSKFELHNREIRFGVLEKIVEKLELSFEELVFIKNGYNFSDRDRIANDFFNMSFNDTETLNRIVWDTKAFLKNEEDYLIRDIHRICEALVSANKTNSFNEATTIVLPIWDRLSKRNSLYVTDILLLNSILFIFPIADVLEIQKFIFRSIDRYNNFRNIERIKINILLNSTLLLIKDGQISDALSGLNELIVLCKKHSTYLQLAVTYVRKGICLNLLNQEGDTWIDKGKNILLALEQNNLLIEIEKEIERSKLEIKKPHPHC
ncbi:helix-turn-helix domain-containing protein [Planococcus sp. X10-3]|uniref:helix-turn-helix domain-containing protein n=1 Tax=Planococcus sp. X10-3 TaxID=3061240 RepID=UPI003BB0250D